MTSYISVFDMLKIGVGPSSSHTLGPWIAALRWINDLETNEKLSQVTSIQVSLYGSLALTGIGHATDKAILLGLSGEDPETIEASLIHSKIEEIITCKKLLLNNLYSIGFDSSNIQLLKDQSLPFHPNGMKFQAFTAHGEIFESVYYSIGGGFVVKEGEELKLSDKAPVYSCSNAKELAVFCDKEKKSISEIVLENEKVLRQEDEIYSKLKKIWHVMQESAYLGCHTEGILPGGLNVKRRAFDLNKMLIRSTNYSNANEWMEAMKEGKDFRKVITRISCIAIAINEVNAAMGKIVTAPTNGSAGVIPAVLFYYLCFSGQKTREEDIVKFLLTAAEIGKYFKTGATISAAAGGCQAEIGVSSSMAAAALTERLGGSPAQALMAAEIAAEHHLGLTCDPVGGLVQIPCIERNSMGAVKAVTASMIALASDPAAAKVSLDNVIKTMKETAENMHTKYKETSLGGLAVHVGLPEC